MTISVLRFVVIVVVNIMFVYSIRITNALWNSMLLISWFVRVKQELERSEEKHLESTLWIEPLRDGKVLIS